MEDTARAVGAGSLEPVTINGKPCQIRPLTIKQLLEVERECLKQYRINYVGAYADTVQFLPEALRERVIREKIDEAAQWDVSDLPPKWVIDNKRVKVNDKIRQWLKESPIFDQGEKVVDAAPDIQLRDFIAVAMGQDMMSDDEYKQLTGYDPPKIRTGYVQWWTSGSMEGMLNMCFACFRKDGVTREDLELDLLQKPDLLIKLSRSIETLTAPALGNG